MKEKKQSKQDGSKQEMSDQSPEESKNTKLGLIREMLELKYIFRFNEVTSTPEIKRILCNKGFARIKEQDLVEMWEYLDDIHIHTSTKQLKKLLYGRLAPKHNPIKEFFSRLNEKYEPRGDGYYIQELARQVKVAKEDEPFWFKYLTKWLVAVVANAVDDSSCKNHTCLILSGGQGIGKTTWLDNLCPPSLKDYSYTGHIQPKDKDSKILISNKFLINIDDQMASVNGRDSDALKNLITIPNIEVRKPYGELTERSPHRASFMGSVNEISFLHDSTGTRRFLCFEVEDIDFQAKVDIDKVWLQAWEYYKGGNFKYWFDAADIKELNSRNERFVMRSKEYESLRRFFTPGQEKESNSILMSNSEIADVLMRHTSHGNFGQKKIGEALTAQGFSRLRRKRGNDEERTYYYLVQPKPELSDSLVEKLLVENNRSTGTE